jgi:hypothetical protein
VTGPLGGTRDLAPPMLAVSVNQRKSCDDGQRYAGLPARLSPIADGTRTPSGDGAAEKRKLSTESRFGPRLGI